MRRYLWVKRRGKSLPASQLCTADVHCAGALMVTHAGPVRRFSGHSYCSRSTASRPGGQAAAVTGNIDAAARAALSSWRRGGFKT